MFQAQVCSEEKLSVDPVRFLLVPQNELQAQYWWLEPVQQLFGLWRL